MKTELTGLEIGEFSEVLRSAFTVEELARLLRIRLERQFDDYAPIRGDYRDAAFRISDGASRQGWIVKLINAARSENPGNTKLYDFAQRFELTAVTAPQLQAAQQRIVRKENKMVYPDVWMAKLGVIEPTICRIEINTDQGAVIYGTGFLVGPRVMLTNYHVMQVVIAGEEGLKLDGIHSAKPENVICRFDYRRLGNGVLYNGLECRLGAPWKIDVSQDCPPDQLAPPDKLDYALVRLASSPGNDVIAPVPGATGKARGWLEPKAVTEFPQGMPLFVLQHPQGDPLKLAFDTDAVTEMNSTQTRVRYRVNTDRGSSGSPCFNQDWELVAIHHSGDPNFDPPHKAEYNEGIPFSQILRSLATRGLGSLAQL